MEDFSVWLAGAARESDYVVVAMDLGSGREFELLQHLVQVCFMLTCTYICTECRCARGWVPMLSCSAQMSHAQGVKQSLYGPE